MKNTLIYTPLAILLILSSCASDTDNSKGESTTKSTAGKSKEVPAGNSTDSGDIYWTGTMVGVYDHRGNVQFSNAEFEIEDGKIATGSFTVDMTSLEPTDGNYSNKEGETRKDFLIHLMAEDFFDVENYPTASFVITSVSDDGETVTGDLTIKGKTQEETVSYIKVGPEGKTVKGVLTFDRTDFGVSFQHPMKDMVISDEVNVTVRLNKN